jgi:hypothetical protein
MSFWDGSQWVADSPPGRADAPRHPLVSHILAAVTEGGLIALLGFGLIAGTAFAAKGGHTNTHGGTTATVTVPDGVFGGTTTAVTTPGLWVYAACSQNGTVVYKAYVQTDATGDAVLTLGPTPMWTSGAAACTAQAGSFSSTGAWRSQASTTFNVSA